MLLCYNKDRVISYLFVTNKVQVMLIEGIWISRRDQLRTFTNKWIVTVGGVFDFSFCENNWQPEVKTPTLFHNPFPLSKWETKSSLCSSNRARRHRNANTKDPPSAGPAENLQERGGAGITFRRSFQLQNLIETMDNWKQKGWDILCVGGWRAPIKRERS